MKRNSVIAAALILAVAGVIIACKQSVANPPGVNGVIVNVESRENSIRVANNQIDTWFNCTERTKITLNGYAASFNQLEAGQRVKVVFDPQTHETLQVDATMRPAGQS